MSTPTRSDRVKGLVNDRLHKILWLTKYIPLVAGGSTSQAGRPGPEEQQLESLSGAGDLTEKWKNHTVKRNAAAGPLSIEVVYTLFLLQLATR